MAERVDRELAVVSVVVRSSRTAARRAVGRCDAGTGCRPGYAAGGGRTDAQGAETVAAHLHDGNIDHDFSLWLIDVVQKLFREY